MKKVLAICLCILVVFSLCACRKNNTGLSSDISSYLNHSNSLAETESQAKTSYTSTNSSKRSKTSKVSDKSNLAEESHIEESADTTNTPDDTEDSATKPSSNNSSYKDIVCVTTYEFQQLNFSTQGSNTFIYVTIPKEWSLKKSGNGYSIIKNSQPIGNISTSATTNSANKSVNVFNGETSTDDMKITHSINRIDSANEPSYTRTLCYNYDDCGKSESIFLTVPYQELDSSAIYKMMSEVKKLKFPQKNMGVLKIDDNRNKILILGNSFVNTSNIGGILQTMCGSEMTIEAQSRGYASVETYTQDNYMMQNIRSGNYSAVFMCGLYGPTDFLELEKIVDACEYSNTKLAIFPAHNENRSQIQSATSSYSNAVLIDWKAEIDALISSGIDSSYFCIADSHKHSTPLAGYVGAHMIYRAVFNKIPQSTHFTQVTPSQISILGEYVTTGMMSLLDRSTTYILE